MNTVKEPIVRKAMVKDVPVIADIVNYHAKMGVMLPRPISRIYDNVRDYVVIESNGDILGCGALHVMWSDLAEIRALALRDEYVGKGLGRSLVDNLLEEAKSLGIEKVFVLTYKADFFKHFGFSVIDKSELPHKIWSECVNCMHFPNCEEVALIRSVK
ncbi:MAG TPA: N-acetyltransferase [Anaerolineae bacterium]|nr:N-acetyltransferase [Anaerolineae bacterium]